MSEFASTYDTLAPRYDQWVRGVVPDVRAAWARRLEPFVAPGESVAELGCGTGRPIGSLLAARYAYLGIDASPGMLAQARRQVTNGHFVDSDMEAIAFETGSLGAVVAFYSIPHVPRQRHGSLFAAISAWLRDGGMFLATLHSHDEHDDFEPDWLGAGPMRWSGFDRDANLAMLTAAGLEVIEHDIIEQTEPDGATIHPLFVVARRPADPSSRRGSANQLDR